MGHSGKAGLLGCLQCRGCWSSCTAPVAPFLIQGSVFQSEISPPGALISEWGVCAEIGSVLRTFLETEGLGGILATKGRGFMTFSICGTPNISAVGSRLVVCIQSGRR